ncbi:hypothetical protein RBI22_15220 [Alcaligenaceae bacterium C4P045]|nr:hypothetical protein [Alcaligenaceae bacterium C4P045]
MDPDELNEQGTGADAGAPSNDNQQGAPADDANAPSMSAFLDSLSGGEGEGGQPPADGELGEDDPANPANIGRPRDEHGRFLPKPAQVEGAAPPAPGQQPPAAAKPTDQRPPVTGEAEEAELLAGVKSERGRARLQEVFAERRQATESLSAVRNMVAASGMDVNSFAQTMEYGRLANSDNPQDLQQALSLLDQQRSAIAKRLGVDVPGVDPLEDFPDLAEGVQNLNINRDHALEIARLRRHEQNVQAQRQQQHQAQQDQQQYQTTVTQGQQQMAQYLQTRASEIDHPARMRVISDHFRDPAKMREFVRTYQPSQWVHALKLMYDGIQASPAARRPGPAPISTRPGAVGRPAGGANMTPEQRTASVIDSLGI